MLAPPHLRGGLSGSFYARPNLCWGVVRRTFVFLPPLRWVFLPSIRMDCITIRAPSGDELEDRASPCGEVCVGLSRACPNFSCFAPVEMGLFAILWNGLLLPPFWWAFFATL